MSRLKPSLTLTLVLLFLAVATVEGWLLWQARARTTRVLATLELKRQERDRLVRQAPSPSAGNEEAVTAAVAEAERVLATLHDEMDGQADGTRIPERAIDGFFELAEFVESTKALAASAQVTVKPTEYFGFASYARAGPGLAALPVVHRQRRAVQHLVGTLLAVRPAALLSVRREPPDEKESDKRPTASEDYFTLSPTHSLRQPGLIDTDAFRLEFTGETTVLRHFLSRLAATPQPVIVRTVEVEQVGSVASKPSHGTGGPEPFLRPSLSKFAVTLEIPLSANKEGGTR